MPLVTPCDASMRERCHSLCLKYCSSIYTAMQEVMEAVMLSQTDELRMHLDKCGAVRSMFLPAWIMTAFAADYHPSVTGRLLDVMLVAGWRAPLQWAATSLILVAGDWLLKVEKMERIVDIIKVCCASSECDADPAQVMLWVLRCSWQPVGAASCIASPHRAPNSHMGARTVLCYGRASESWREHRHKH